MLATRWENSLKGGTQCESAGANQRCFSGAATTTLVLHMAGLGLSKPATFLFLQEQQWISGVGSIHAYVDGEGGVNSTGWSGLSSCDRV